MEGSSVLHNQEMVEMGSRNVASERRSVDFNQSDPLFELYEAAQEGDVYILENLLRTNPRILKQVLTSSYDETPVHLAAEGGHDIFARRILERLPQLVNVPDRNGRTPLHLAVANGSYCMVRLLLAYGDSADCCKPDPFGRLPIHLAIMRGWDRIVWLLMNHEHLDQDSQAEHCAHMLREAVIEENNALQVCVRYNNINAFKLIVACFLNRNDKAALRCKDGEGHNLMQTAIKHKRNQIVRFLLDPSILGEEGAEMADDNGFNSMEMLEQSGQEEDFRTKDIKYFLRKAGWQPSAAQQHHEVRRKGKKEKFKWYRLPFFKLLDYDEKWVRNTGTQAQTTAHVILAACIQIAGTLESTKDRQMKEDELNHRQHIMDSTCTSGVFSLIMMVIISISGVHLSRTKLWMLCLIVSSLVSTYFLGFSFLGMLQLASPTGEYAWNGSIVKDILKGCSYAVFASPGLRLVRFFLEKKH